MRAVIVGLGSIGARHLANLKAIDPASYITVLHHCSGAINPTDTLADSNVHRLEDALNAKPDIAIISGPTSQHVEAALPFARQGVHLFIEKPLSHDMRAVDELLETCHRRNLLLMVGYNLRFYRPLQLLRQALIEGRIGVPLMIKAEVGQYLPDWRPGRDYRESVSARRELGGGAVLELSHELDYARWLLGEVQAVSAQIAHLSDLEIDVDDVADINLQFRCGVRGNIHLDMIRRPATRTCTVYGSGGTLSWDGISHETRLFSADTGSWITLHPAVNIERNEMYLAELRHFMECVENNNAPVVTGEDGRRVLEIALAAQRSSAEGRVVDL